MHQDQTLEMAGIVFNGLRRTNTPPEQTSSCNDVKKLASQNNWHVFDNSAYHSDSYPTGSRDGNPIFMTSYARQYVIDEFNQVGDEFLKRIKVK